MADGFYYYRYLSTAAVYYINNTNPNDSLELFTLRPAYQAFFRRYGRFIINFIPRPFTILSSSNGFILCRDRFNSYHVLSPHSHMHHQIPDPERPHNTTTPAVISFSWVDGFFYVICAVDESQGHYTFDVFHSDIYEWTTQRGPIDLDEGQGRILLNTGVSCHRVAFWLTEGPQHPVVVRHFLDLPVESQSSIIEDGIPVIPVEPRMRMQLGRIDDQLGLVIVDGIVAQIFKLDNNRRWRILGMTSVENIDGESVISLQPLRFESFKLEVLFSAVGQHRRFLVHWESDAGFRMMRESALPGSENAAAAADGAVPYVISNYDRWVD